MKEYIFISYKSEQRETALRIKEILEENGISCWMAPESIPGGSSYASEITTAIDNCKEFLVVLSSMAQDSQYVIKELDSAIKRKKVVLPFVIEDFIFNNNLDYYLTDVQLYPAYLSWESTLEKMIREIRWAFQSINATPNPDTVLKDPIKLGSALPHVLENGYLLFGRYRIKKMLGVYATSQQHYLGIDEHTDKEVLINYIDRTIPYKEMSFGASTAGTLFQHPYIASPIDEYSNESYFVHIEPFYDVRSLKEIVSTSGPQDYRDIIKWAIAICHAMIYLNEDMGYIYGQMTSNNIRIQKNGLPILFDISTATPLNSEYYGSFDPLILAPETLRGQAPATPTIDIYALGINMYYALTGDKKQSTDEVAALDKIPQKMRAVIEKCLNNNITKRYQTFRDVLYDLEHIADFQSKPGFWSRFKKH